MGEPLRDTGECDGRCPCAEQLDRVERLLEHLVGQGRRRERLLHSFRSAARLIGRDRETVARWARDGRLRTVMVDGVERVPSSELVRIEREGVPERPSSGKRRQPRRRARKPLANKPMMSAAEIQSRLKEF